MDGGRDRRQRRGFDLGIVGVGVVVVGSAVDDRGDRLNHRPEAGGQHLFQLGEGAGAGELDPRESGGGPEPDCHGDGLLVVEHEGRQLAAGSQPVAAGGTAVRIHGILEFAQAVDVLADGAGGDPEASGELGARPFGPGLEQGE